VTELGHLHQHVWDPSTALVAHFRSAALMLLVALIQGVFAEDLLAETATDQGGRNLQALRASLLADWFGRVLTSQLKQLRSPQGVPLSRPTSSRIP
jgi:hypothetical protein